LEDEERRELVSEFKEKALPALVERLERQVKYLENKTINDFEFVISQLVLEVMNECRQIAQIESFSALDRTVKGAITKATIAGFNGVLPLNYPFVIAFLEVQKEGSSYIIALPRSILPAFEKLPTPNIVPICIARDIEDMKIRRVRLDDIILPDEDDGEEPLSF